MASVTASNPDGLSTELRMMLDSWQRSDLARVAATRKLLGLDPLLTEAEWRRRESRGGHGASDDGREEGRR